jgi:hypothetical protein
MENYYELIGKVCIWSERTWTITSMTTNMLGTYLGLRAGDNKAVVFAGEVLMKENK